MNESGCSAETTEPFALRVIGDSMVPEFNDGHIIIIDPGLPAVHEAYVVIEHREEMLFGQYRMIEGQPWLYYLNSAFAPVQLLVPFEVKGVIVQRSTGRRRDLKHYDYPELRH